MDEEERPKEPTVKVLIQRALSLGMIQNKTEGRKLGKAELLRRVEAATSPRTAEPAPAAPERPTWIKRWSNKAKDQREVRVIQARRKKNNQRKHKRDLYRRHQSVKAA